MPRQPYLHRMPLMLSLVVVPGLGLGLGCGGSHFSGDHAGAANTTAQLLPSTPTVITGQSLQFHLVTPWSGDALWSVQPATAGTITSDGLFTAAQAPGSCTILAVWAKDVRYTASAGMTIFPPPVSATTSPNFVQATGSQATTAGGGVENASIVGENVPAILSTSANLTIQVRHGFDPPHPD